MSASALMKRFELMTLRERAIVVLAMLGLLVFAWDTLLMNPLRLTRNALELELASAGSVGVPQSTDVSDPRQVSIARAGELQTQLQSIDGQLKNTASGFVASDRMIEVLHDVLERQGRLKLVSIRNLPVTGLIAPVEPVEPTGPAEPDAPAQPPYVHSIEIIIDGEYADIIDYLAALETLPWKFRWDSLDLLTTGYPRNRVRIELSTLSLDSTWLGV
jgi:MSHA biogenesis protein MshJ